MLGGKSRREWMFHQWKWNEEESGKKTFWRNFSNLIKSDFCNVKRVKHSEHCHEWCEIPLHFFKKFKACQKFQQSFRELWVIPTHPHPSNFSRNSLILCEWKRLRSLNNVHGSKRRLVTVKRALPLPFNGNFYFFVAGNFKIFFKARWRHFIHKSESSLTLADSIENLLCCRKSSLYDNRSELFPRKCRYFVLVCAIRMFLGMR